MKKLTDRRLAVLSFIRQHIEAKGQAPTLAELAQGLGFASKSAVRKHVTALQADGLLEAAAGTARGARLKTTRDKVTSAASTLFEIGPDDVRGLSDGDLRELVARLCAARLTAKGYPSDYVIWGGNQSAADGGIDVRVEMPPNVADEVGFPCRTVAIQVKATSMRPSDIRTEMCPGGVLRSSIRDIIRMKGAYLIASSDSVTDEKLRERVAAMKAAAREGSDAEKAVFDFYDATRLADWTNRHAGVVAWVRTRLGRALHGWKPWGQWATTRGGQKQSFVDDTSPRLIDPSDPDREYTLADGLRHVRELLRRGGASVRIVGLSGVGKTRFAEALFEEAAAPGALSPNLAVYADSADSPSPAPQTLLDELHANNRRAILVVDNCSSQLHSDLTARLKAGGGVTLLTIEYDIREDDPDETKVVRLARGSAELVSKIIHHQFPNISQVNVATISDFADGNARVAIALANTLDQRDSLAGLTHDTLFERLFWQRREVDPLLRRAAEICALVYSFDGEGGDGELAFLASLAEMSMLDLHRQVDELMKRGLAQKRGPWRAVLPHAIANTLARRALSALPFSLIESRFVDGHSRLLKSFSRRLGYLHESEEARGIVRRWYTEGGLFGDVADLKNPLVDVLINVAPVDPEATLELFERSASKSDAFFSMQNMLRTRIARLLRSIAYDPRLFERSLALLLPLAVYEPSEQRNDRTENLIQSMFAIRLSGTRASADQRANWIQETLKSEDPKTQNIAIECLNTALEVHHFSSIYPFDFGARSRDYGYSPQGEDATAWFKRFLALAVGVAIQPNPLGDRIRGMLATKFRSLWAGMHLYSELEHAAAQLLSLGWEKGWLAINETLRIERKEMPDDVLTRLSALEARARPQTLVERTKAVVLNYFAGGLDITIGEDADTSAYERAEQQAIELGQNVANDSAAFTELLPLLVDNRQGRQWMFGVGLAKGVTDPVQTWNSLVAAHDATQPDRRNLQVLRGFLNGMFKRDRGRFEAFLDQATAHPALALWLPILLLVERLDSSSCRRLLNSMENPNIPTEIYSHLGFGRATTNLDDDEITLLLRRLSRLPDGLDVAIDVLSMHIHGDSKSPGPQLSALSRELLAQFSPKRHGPRLDFALRGIVAKFLKGTAEELAARALLQKLKKALDAYTLSPYEVSDTLEALVAVQPIATLDVLIGDDHGGTSRSRRRDLRDADRRSFLRNLPVQTLIQWCESGGLDRWQHMAASIPLFAPTGESETPRLSGTALGLLQGAPDPLAVAGMYVERLEPTSWTGSRAAAMAAHLPILDELAAHMPAEASPMIALWRSQLRQAIEQERRQELAQHRTVNERFE